MSRPAQSGREEECDRGHLRRAIELSRIAAPGAGDLPFGAVVARGEEVLGEAHNEIASRCDPTAHAEILALRAAGGRLHRPVLDGAVLYSSSEPCPMCLAACYWAQIERVVHAATVQDADDCGFDDAVYYRELAKPPQWRTLRMQHADAELHDEALTVLRRYTAPRSAR